MLDIQSVVGRGLTFEKLLRAELRLMRGVNAGRAAGPSYRGAGCGPG